LIDAHRLTEDGIFRTLALGVRVSRSASLARDAVGRTIATLVAEMERDGRLALPAGKASRRRGTVGTPSGERSSQRRRA
jgi:hypothetical protein